MTHRMKTAAAMGIMKLYKVGTHKVYVRESDYFIKADSLREAQLKWDRYKRAKFLDPNTQIPEDIIYKHQEYRDTEYDYDYDNTQEDVIEVEFNKDMPVHHEALEELYNGDPKEPAKKQSKTVD
jgi:hypothetical protein